MNITHYLHTAVLVSDLAAAERFYGGVLGLTKVERSLRFPGAWYQLGEIQVHLMVSDSLPPAPTDSEKWGRHRHLAFAVTDLQEATVELQAQGYPVQLSASGRAALFTQDPDGNVVELTQLH